MHVQSERMAELMAESDLAIGAAGTSSWERCCLGLPALLVSLAENQLPIARSVAERGAGLYLGSHAEVTAAAIGAAVEDLRREPDRLAAMARTAAELVDGQGVQRVMVQLKERS
jgi:spore coat polysaccharide biosynthesis predicted glycosyltransferase SpsG